MEKKERIIVFATGFVLLLIFTFTDLQISMVIARKPTFARILEVVGEIPFTLLSITGCAVLIRFRNQTSLFGNLLGLLGGGILFVLLIFMGGFMTWNYMSRNLGELSKALIVMLGVVMAAAAIWITLKIPEEKQKKALRFAGTALIYFLLVIIVMNLLKTMWGRMRFREMTDPLNEFTRWYEICGRGKFMDAYASFPSGHSMNSAGVILLLLLPDIIPALQEKKRLLRICVYVWCVAVGGSRILMGAHFASDVTIGIMLSLMLFELVNALL